MGEKTKISWTASVAADGSTIQGATFNPWWSCTKVDACCANCYAETLANRWGYPWGPTAPRRIFGPKHWAEPLAWNAKAAKTGQPMRVFCGSMCDWAEDRRDLDDERAKLWKLIEATPALTWLLLTKRAENIRLMLPTIQIGAREPLLPRFDNVWVGVTVGMRANLERIAELRQVPATVRFLSCEPLLEDLGRIDLRGISWCIVGGESGPSARQCSVEWIRSIVKQCREAGVKCFVKQLGANCQTRNDDNFTGDEGDPSFPKWPDHLIDRIVEQPHGGYQGAPVRVRFHDRAGSDPTEWPEDLRVREMPARRAP